MNLSKSKYCEGIQCNKILWLEKNKPDVKSDVANQSVLDNGTEVGLLAKKLFGEYIDIDFSENLNDMIKDTNEALKNDIVTITEASFVYDNNFCSVDILKKNGNDVEIYEVKSSTKVKDIYKEDVSYQTYILLNLGYNVKKACIVHINSNYERVGDLNLNELFVIEDFTELVMSKQSFIKEKISEINEYMKSSDEPIEKIDMHCITPYDCPFFDYCTRALPEKNVFKVRNMRNSMKFSLYNKGIYSFEDLLNEDIDWKYKQQIEFDLYNKPDEVDKTAIKSFLDTLTYPLYFLDFETYQQSIPEFDHVKPYSQIPFQYSLHYIEKENGKLFHKEFLSEANIDPRRLLAETLVRDIPINVCTIAYNMSFEKMVIKNLAALYPDLREHLMNIHDNMKDLMIPFKERKYYTKKMDGSFSIKYVLPALFPNDEELDYHNLELIHNGGEAMDSYKHLTNYSPEEQKKIRTSLLKYCELDTYAMVKIWQKLNEIVKNS